MTKFPEALEIPLGKRSFKYRFFEILPGALSWFIISLPVTLTILDPSSRLAAIFILFFMMSWFYRAVAMGFRTLQGYHRMKASERVPWDVWLDDLEHPIKAVRRLHRHPQRLDRSARHHLDNLQTYQTDTQLHDLAPSDIVQFVIVPMWKESYEVVGPTIQSIADSRYDGKKVIVVIAYEQRGGAEPEATAHKLVADFKQYFKHMEAIQHPADIPNEVVGKGGNITWAAQQFMPYFKKNKIAPHRVLVTTLDADNHPHRDYLAHLTYSYILTHDRKRHSYQPLALYTNNIWDVPAPMRVLAVGNSFFTIVQSARPHLLRNFSSHSQSLDALLETGFWSTRTIVEDGHQFWRSYFTFRGKYSIIPIHSPIYQDAVLSETYRATLKDQFTQIRRWAYGASDIPYLANLGFRRKKDRLVPLWDLTLKFLRLLDTHVSWATISLILLLAARVPLLVGPQADKSIVAHQLPLIASYAQTIALITLSISIFYSLKLLPPRPERYKRRRSILMVLQWVLLPLTSIVYGSLAALNSQTRLMIGKYLDKFDLTHKGRKTDLSK